MKIAKVENNLVTAENDIVATNDILPQILIDDGWLVLEEISPVLKEHEKLNSGSYDIQATKVVVTYLAIDKITLADYKTELIARLSIDSYLQIENVIPAARQRNSALGIVYTEYTKQQVIDTVENFRTEYYRVKDLINAAVDHGAAKTQYDTKNFPIVVAT